MNLVISANNLDQRINYINPVKNIQLKSEFPKVEDTYFLVKNHLKEVKDLPKKEKKTILKTFKQTQMTLASWLTIGSTPAMAQTQKVPEGAIMPQDLIQIFIYLITMLVIISLGTSVLLGLSSGLYGMFGKAEKAKKWRIEIIKALVQGLATIPIVALIWFLYTKLFGDLDWFSIPF